MILYELCGASKELAFSPYCWSIKMALKHKGLDFTSQVSPFTDKSAFAASGSKTVPVIKDGEKWVSDSWHIAVYLEEKYPEHSLFGGPEALSLSKFISNWTTINILMPVFKMLAADISVLLEPEDEKYFRETRELRLGKTLEELRDMRPELIKQLNSNLKALEMTLDTRPFLAGENPGYADYIVFGAFQWARQVSSFNVMPEDGPLEEWFDSLLDMFDGYARSAPTV